MQEKMQLEAPIIEVMLLEDRAHVLRRGNVSLPAGISHLEVADIAPVVSDKTLTARITATDKASVGSARIVRFAKALREERPGRVRELEKLLESVRREVSTSTRQVSLFDAQARNLDRVEDLVLQELEQDAAWNRNSNAEAETALNQCGQDLLTLQTSRAELALSLEEKQRNVRDLEQRLTQVSSPATRTGARIEADIVMDAAGFCEIEFSYIVPGACWRPWHTAERSGGPKPQVQFRSDACVWQNTGEDWTGVNLVFSTERSSLGVEPPELESDVLEARPKAAVVKVQAREQIIQHTGLGAAAASTTELPGIDDGGDIIAVRGATIADVPSDGRPHRVPYASFQAAAECELVLMPELSPSAIWKTVQTNTGSMPLLAGPVDLLGDGGFIGRTLVRLVAPNERFPLGWGTEAALRVHRETEQMDLESGVMVNRVTTRRTVTLRLSNIDPDELTVNVIERVPISEIEQVEISVDTEKTTDAKVPDENGFVTWKVAIPAFGRHSLRLVYSVKRRKDVAGI